MLCVCSFLGFVSAHTGSLINAFTTVGIGIYIASKNSQDNENTKNELRTEMTTLDKNLRTDFRTEMSTLDKNLRTDFRTEMRVMQTVLQGCMLSTLESKKKQMEMVQRMHQLERCVRSGGKDCYPGKGRASPFFSVN